MVIAWVCWLATGSGWHSVSGRKTYNNICYVLIANQVCLRTGSLAHLIISTKQIVQLRLMGTPLALQLFYSSEWNYRNWSGKRLIERHNRHICIFAWPCCQRNSHGIKKIMVRRHKCLDQRERTVAHEFPSQCHAANMAKKIPVFSISWSPDGSNIYLFLPSSWVLPALCTLL